MYSERVRGCDGDVNTGVGGGVDVVVVSVIMWVVHAVHVLVT